MTFDDIEGRSENFIGKNFILEIVVLQKSIRNYYYHFLSLLFTYKTIEKIKPNLV